MYSAFSQFEGLWALLCHLLVAPPTETRCLECLTRSLYSLTIFLLSVNYLLSLSMRVEAVTLIRLLSANSSSLSLSTVPGTDTAKCAQTTTWLASQVYSTFLLCNFGLFLSTNARWRRLMAKQAFYVTRERGKDFTLCEAKQEQSYLQILTHTHILTKMSAWKKTINWKAVCFCFNTNLKWGERRKQIVRCVSSN